MLKMFAVTLAAPIADSLNFSFSECRCLRAWKLGDIPDISVTVWQGFETNHGNIHIIQYRWSRCHQQILEAHSSIIYRS